MQLFTLLLACSPDPSGPCALAAAIVPGCGVTVGGAEVRLGDTAAEVEAALGAPDSRRDLGAAGLLLSWGSVSAYVEDDGVVQITVEPGFEGATAEGVGPGSGEASVRDAWGEPSVEPFTTSGLYAEAGAAVELETGVVTRVHVLPSGG